VTHRTLSLFIAVSMILNLGIICSASFAALGEVCEGRLLATAIKSAEPGDTLIVSGNYTGSTLVVDKPLTIIGKGAPVIECSSDGHVIEVVSSGVTIRGFVVRGAPVSFVDDNAAILLESVEDCAVDSNRFENNFFAVYLAKSRDCSVVSNQIVGSAKSETSSGNGIHLWYCRDILVAGNDVRGHRDGVYFEFVKHSRIVDNYSSENLRYGLHFMFSDSCMYKNNDFVDNGAGVAVMYTHSVRMSGNRFVRNWGPSSYGLLLKEISDSEVYGNLFQSNTTGVYVEGCNRVLVAGNDFERNGWGVKIMANSIDCAFTHNNFLGNSFQVATNSRQNFSSFDNNYWSDYRGFDLDRDGTGDVPFRPVSLFSLVVERNTPTLILLRSLAVEIMNVAERLFPTLTPESLVDNHPLMERVR